MVLPVQLQPDPAGSPRCDIVAAQFVFGLSERMDAADMACPGLERGLSASIHHVRPRAWRPGDCTGKSSFCAKGCGLNATEILKASLGGTAKNVKILSLAADHRQPGCGCARGAACGYAAGWGSDYLAGAAECHVAGSCPPVSSGPLGNLCSAGLPRRAQ
ncbi:hypothetical protein D3C73_1137930 [compost metagenome]